MFWREMVLRVLFSTLHLKIAKIVNSMYVLPRKNSGRGLGTLFH